MRGCQYLIGLLRFAATEEYYQLEMTVRLLELTAKSQVHSYEALVQTFLSPFCQDSNQTDNQPVARVGSRGGLLWICCPSH